MPSSPAVALIRTPSGPRKTISAPATGLPSWSKVTRTPSVSVGSTTDTDTSSESCRPSVDTVRVAVNVPLSGYAWSTALPVAVLPSPKDHSKVSMLSSGREAPASNRRDSPCTTVRSSPALACGGSGFWARTTLELRMAVAPS